MVLMVVVLALVTILIGFVAIVGGGGKSKKTGPVVSTAPPVPQTETVAPRPKPAPDGAALARNLQIEEALTAWEAAVASGRGDPTLRQKIASSAFEVARAYAAVNDSTNAARNFQRVVKYGQADSAEVLYASSRIH